MVVARTEFFGEHAINIFNESQNNSRHFTQSIAQMKTIQGDNQAFYVCDLGTVIHSLQQWFSYLPRISPFYSVNCNSDPVLLRILSSHPNVGFHCITKNDLDIASDLIPAGRILYANPVWTRNAIRTAAQNQAGLITIQSMGDLDRILVTFPQASMLLNVSMAPNSEDPATELGCNFEEACEILQRAVDDQANIRGISFTVGSGCRNPSLYSSAIEACFELFKIAKGYGLQMDILNIGGGFSNASFEKMNNAAAFVDICNEINASLNYYFPAENFSNLRIIAQPGRFFAGEAFALSTPIIGKSSCCLSEITHDDFDFGSQAYVYQINEGYYGSFACQNVPNCQPKCIPLFESEADKSTSKQYYGNVIGPTLDEYDIAQSMCHLRQMFEGEWLLWNQMGSYSRNNRGSLGDIDIPDPSVYYYCNNADFDCIQRLISMESITPRPTSISSTTQLPTRRSSFSVSFFDGHMEEDECYGSFSDISDTSSCNGESVGSAEDEWMSRWKFQGPIFD